MNRYLEIAREAGVKSPKHYNKMQPRIKQGKNRQKKGGYQAMGVRARQHDPEKGA